MGVGMISGAGDVHGCRLELMDWRAGNGCSRVGYGVLGLGLMVLSIN